MEPESRMVGISRLAVPLRWCSIRAFCTALALLLLLRFVRLFVRLAFVFALASLFLLILLIQFIELLVSVDFCSLVSLELEASCLSLS